MLDATSVLGSVLPVVVLVVLGMVLRRFAVLDDATVAGLKKLIVSVALPALLFTTFLTTRFAPEHGWVIAIVFAICVALLGVGWLYRRVVGGSVYTPLLFTGFELGMIGFAIFTAVYGTDQLPALGVLALGHEVFIWFVFVSLLRALGHERADWRRTARELISSPVIIAILLGLLLNLTGLAPVVTAGPIGAAVTSTLMYLAAVIVPLVLIIVGYGTRLDAAGVRAALPLVATRLAIVIPLALALGAWVFTGLLGLAPIYATALFTLLVLPPPYIVPIFMPAERRTDQAYANNVLSLYTVASLVAFLAYVSLTA
jgi:predicted permease